jgi:topoisomerase IA-like protein
MEKRLDRIAEGTEPWKQILHDIWQSYQERYHTLLQGQKDRSNAKVREFTNGLKAVQSKKGPLLLIEGAKKEDTIFIGWPANVSFEEMTEEIAHSFQKEEEKKKEEIGRWRDQPIQKKSGKFGTYLQCGDVSVPFIEEEIEKTVERLEAKANAKANSSVIKEFKQYVIRNGQYGPYIIKTSVKKMQFVSLPKGLDGATLTEKEVEVLYQAGLAKKKWGKK